MRLALALAGLAAIVCTGTAAAGQVALAPVTYSSQFQTALTRDLGEREGRYLSQDVTRAVAHALERHGATLGAGGLTVEVSIVDADPNRFTMQQLSHNPDIDWGRSVSLGGAELHAVIKDANGNTVREIDHRRYDRTFADLVGPPATWSSAQRAIDQFAEKVADAYDAQAAH